MHDNVQIVERATGLTIHPPAVDKGGARHRAGRFTTKKQVVRGVEGVAEGKILIYHLNAKSSGSSGVVVSNGCSFEQNFPFVWSYGTREDFH